MNGFKDDYSLDKYTLFIVIATLTDAETRRGLSDAEINSA